MTPNRNGVVAFVRFQLAQLRATNGQHDFERICRHYARATICPRILPATGPVQAGGDQGRDFESFVGTVPGGLLGFGEPSNNQRIAFTCTLQQKRIEAKIRSDLAAILKAGASVGVVHTFVEVDLAVSRRHKIQDWARSRGVELTIHDGQALAEGIATPTEFWIAVEFLHVPCDMWPKSTDFDYSERKARWMSANNGFAVAHFQECRELARYCSYREELGAELPFWWSALRNTMEKHPVSDIRRRAAYEVVMTAWYARHGELAGTQNEIRFVMNQVASLENYGAVSDACNLLGVVKYWVDGGGDAGEVGGALGRWGSHLIARIKELMGLESKTGVLVLRELLVYLDDRFSKPESAVAELNDIVEQCRSCALFPVSCAAKRIEMLAIKLANTRGYSRLTSTLDDIIAKREGIAAAAAQRLRRAHRLYDSGDILSAIRELQRAKPAWYGSGRLRETAECLRDLSNWYLELGLPLAAKYNAQTASGLLLGSDGRGNSDVLSEVLRLVVTADFLQGAWLKAADLAGAAIGGAFNANSDIENAMRDCGPMMAVLGVVLAGARLWNPDMEARLRAALFESEYPLARELDPSRAWTIADWEDLWRQGELDDLYGLPFSDAEPTRTIRWSALGVNWGLKYKNDLDLDRLGEQIAAALQLTMADIGTARDLEVVRDNILIILELADEDAPTLEELAEESDDQEHLYSLRWPRAPGDAGTLFGHLALAGSMVLASVSMLPHMDLTDVISPIFSQEGSHRLLFSKTMSCLDDEMNLRRAWALRAPGIGPKVGMRARPHAMLQWTQGVSTRYQANEVEEVMARRYCSVQQSTRLTLPRLLQCAEFRTAIRNLRVDGFLDWQILNAVAVLAANERYCVEYGEMTDPSDESAGIIRTWATEPEREDWLVVPSEVFSELALRRILDCNMVASLIGIGLCPRWSRPNFPALREYMSERFKYFLDDMKHEDPFLPPHTASPPLIP